MTRIVGYCGIVCSDCPVLIATKNDDNDERKKVATLFTKQYGREYKPEDINCDGCIANGPRLFRYCANCKWRTCAREKNLENCAHCDDYPCESLSGLFSQYAKAKETLDAIRQEILSSCKEN